MERGLEEISEDKEFLRVLRKVHRTLLKSDDKEEALSKIPDLISSNPVFGCTFIALIPEGLTSPLLYTSNSGESTTDVKDFHTPEYFSTVLDERGITISDVTSGANAHHPHGTKSHPGVALPLSHDDVDYGIITIHLPPQMVVEEQYKSLLKDLANDIGFFIYNSRLQEEKLQVRRNLQKKNKDLEKYKHIIEKTTDLFTILDRTGNIKYVNPSAVEKLGFSESELIGQNVFNLVHPDDFKKIKERFTSVLSGEEKNERTTEFRIEKKSGGYIWVEATSQNQVDNPAIGGISVSARNITAEKKREEELSTVLDSMGDAAFVHGVGEDTSFLTVNSAAVERYGYSEEELKSMTPSDLSPSDDESVQKRIKKVEQTGEYIFEGEQRTKNGKIVPVEINATRLQFKGKTAVLAIAREITRRKEHEQHLKVFNRFFRHNMRNLVNILQGNVELLRISDDTEPVIETLEESVASLNNLSEKAYQVNQLMGDDSGELKEMKVEELVNSCKILENNDTSIILGDMTETPVLTLKQVSRAFNELIHNGIKHNNSESPRVTIWSETNNEHVKVYLKDNGPGIPKDEYIGLIEDGRLNQVTHGSGFGLWLAYWIIRRGGGDIDIHTDNHGTLVTINLPKGIPSDSQKD